MEERTDGRTGASRGGGGALAVVAIDLKKNINV